MCGKLMLVPTPPLEERRTAKDAPLAAPVPTSGHGPHPEEEGNSGRADLTLDGVRSRPSALGAAAELFAGAIVLLLGLAHVFHEDLARGGIPAPADTDYLSIPSPLWSTLVFTLAGILILDAIGRLRARSRAA